MRRSVTPAKSRISDPPLPSLITGAELGCQLFDDRTWHSLRNGLRLSPRELEVLKAIFDDRKEASISHELGISPHTVHTYVGRIYMKLRVSSRIETVTTVVAAAANLRQHDVGQRRDS